MEPTIELYGTATGNCLRAAIALEEAALPYLVRHLDPYADEQHEASFLAINPAGKVPVLIERSGGSELALSQSNALIMYASDRTPGHLLPSEIGRSRAVTFERFFYFITDVIAVTHAAFALRSTPKAQEAQRLLRKRSVEAMSASERFLRNEDYMAGSRYSMADIAGYTVAHHLKNEIDWSGHPTLARWFKRVGDRTAVARGMRAFDRRTPGSGGSVASAV